MKYMANSGCRGLGVLLLAASLVMQPVWADDTELYFNPAPPDAPDPLVMFSLDLRSSLAGPFCAAKNDDCRQQFGGDDIGDFIYAQLETLDIADGAPVSKVDAFKAALIAIFMSDIPDNKQIGFMVSHDSGNNSCTTGSSGCSQGGYIVRGFETLGPDDPLTADVVEDPNGARAELAQIIKDLPLNQGSAAHPYQGIGLFMELYRYLAGLKILHGKLGYTDYQSKNPKGTPNRNLDYEFSVGRDVDVKCQFTETGGNTGDNRDCDDYIDPTNGYDPATDSNLNAGGVRIPSTLTWDPGIMAGDSYISPYTDGDWSCSGAFTINMLFGVSDDGGKGNPNGVAAALPIASEGLGLPNNSSFTQVIAKLKNFDHAGGQAGAPDIAGEQTLTSYFLTPSTGPTKGQVDPYAVAGGTTAAIPVLDDPRAVFNAIKNAFDQINSISSTYVAVTVPVNADNRVTSLPNMFVALFQVDENGRPLWPGNIKKLDVTVEPDDFTGIPVLEVQDAGGNPAFNPITGRINDDALTLWTVPGEVDDVFPADPDKLEVPGRDGSSVRRGGAGQKTPGYRSGSVGDSNEAVVGARKIFLEPENIDTDLAAGNALVALDASDVSGALRENVDVQTRFGFRDTTVACSETDGTYCLSAIKKVLDAANIPYPEPPPDLSAADKEDMALEATQALLRWIRGFDVFNDNGASGTPNGLTTTAQRKWLMGDVLHSRPVAINYGARAGYSEDNQDVRLVFGANDGLLRMVRNTMSGASEPNATTQEGSGYGEEVWAFMPRELLNHVPRLAMTTSNVGVNRPYGVDGEPTLFTIDTNSDGIIDNDSSCTIGADDCDRAWVYFGLRRGGKSYYAIDVSNPDAASPKLLWKIDDSMTDFAELGLTFSTPRVGWVQLEDAGNLNLFGPDDTNVPIPVVIVGGGYHGHAVQSGDHHVSGADSKDKLSYYGGDTGEGNAVFIIHARTGELIWKVTGGTGDDTATHSFHADMEHGIAAAVAPMDANGNGILDRLYVPDTGGRVWRIDIPEYVPGISPDAHRQTNWKATLLADLRPSDAALASSTDDDLRFFHHATIVRRAHDNIGAYDAIAVGSGDREHPQSETNKNNWFFLFKDRNVISGDPAVATRASLAPGDLLDITDICLNVTGGEPCTGDLTHGWRLALEEKGEKNLSSPFIGGNGIIFTTYLPEGKSPDDKDCVPLGTSRLYQVGLNSGEPLRFLHDVVGNTFSKTDRWIDLYSGIDGGVVAVSPEFWITATGKSGGNPAQRPIQFYWRESGVDTVQ